MRYSLYQARSLQTCWRGVDWKLPELLYLLYFLLQRGGSTQLEVIVQLALHATMITQMTKPAIPNEHAILN